jgi:hypothetical protein
VENHQFLRKNILQLGLLVVCQGFREQHLERHIQIAFLIALEQWHALSFELPYFLGFSDTLMICDGTRLIRCGRVYMMQIFCCPGQELVTYLGADLDQMVVEMLDGLLKTNQSLQL